MTRRYAEIDAIKGLAILVVILIHSMRPQWAPDASSAEIWLGQLTRFAVPGFLATSGFLYATRKKVAWETTLRRLRRILVPYLIASIAAQVFLVARGTGRGPESIAMDLLVGSNQAL